MAAADAVPDIAIATITWARDPDEARLIESALRAASAVGLPIAVADGGSDEAFRSAIRALPRVTLVDPSERGLVPQVRASLQTAQRDGSRFILYAESDKRQFFEDSLAGFLARVPLADDVGVVVAGRSADSFATFPPLQRFAEGTINTLTGEFVRVEGDYSYGPFLMHRRLVPYLDPLEAEIGWGWRHYVFAIAHRLGMKVVHVPGDFPCPEDQRGEDADERLHRLTQLSQNVQGLRLGMVAELSDRE